jgi:citrate lyase subunit beta / citryl-CoA lyase
MVRARSLLFVPGDRPERFAKAESGGADIAIVDLEDGVSRSAVVAARGHVREWLVSARPTGGATRAIRVSPARTDDHELDLIALTGVPLPDVIVIPKAESAASLSAIAQRLGISGPQLLAGIETVRGVLAASELLSVPHVGFCYFGAEDYIADLGGVRTVGGTEVLAARSLVAMHARVNDVVASDQIVSQYNDLERLEIDAELGRSLGYRGKICIHPSQVAVVNRVFDAGGSLAWARRVLEVAGQHDGGVFTVDGQMIDGPLIAQAQRIVAGVAAK